MNTGGIKFLQPILNIPAINAIMTGILPGIMLLVFLALLPTILEFFCIGSGFMSKSEVDFGVITRFYIFQVGRWGGGGRGRGRGGGCLC